MPFEYAKQTQEYVDGKYVAVTADFRKYLCVEDSIADHSAYLLGAMNGKRLRYEGLKECKDYRKAAQIIRTADMQQARIMWRGCVPSLRDGGW